MHMPYNRVIQNFALPNKSTHCTNGISLMLLWLPTSIRSVFVKRVYECDFIVLLLYVDDMLIIGHDANKIKKLKGELSGSYKINSWGEDYS